MKGGDRGPRQPTHGLCRLCRAAGPGGGPAVAASGDPAGMRLGRRGGGGEAHSGRLCFPREESAPQQPGSICLPSAAGRPRAAWGGRGPPSLPPGPLSETPLEMQDPHARVLGLQTQRTRTGWLGNSGVCSLAALQARRLPSGRRQAGVGSLPAGGPGARGWQPPLPALPQPPRGRLPGCPLLLSPGSQSLDLGPTLIQCAPVTPLRLQRRCLQMQPRSEGPGGPGLGGYSA